MRFDEFFGGSYESQSFLADQQRTINWYPEKVQSTGRPALYPTPGVELLFSADDNANAGVFGGAGRAHFAESGVELAVIGSSVWSMTASAISYISQLDNVGHDVSEPATISSNGAAGGTYLITSAGNGYLYDPSAGTVTPIAALADKADFGAYLDGYFVALDVGTSTLFWSELNDGSTWNTGTAFANRNLGSDKWLSMKVMERGIWLFGEHTTEVWYNTGNSRQPFAPAASGVIEFGILAPWSVEVLGNNILWLGRSRNGRVCVLRGHGFQPNAISTYALENAIDGYDSRTTAIADAYSEGGHSFYLLNFDVDNITWAWDSETGLWHERGSWDSSSKRYTSWRPRFHAHAFGQHRMLDTSNGNVYHMSQDFPYDVGGKVIRRLRRAPAINEENTDLFYGDFELEFEPGRVQVDCHVGFHMEGLTIADITFTESAPPSPEATITFETDVTGGSGTYTYLWELLDESGAVESTSTDEDATFDFPVAICGDKSIRVTVTDTVTAALAVKSRGPFSTATCP